MTKPDAGDPGPEAFTTTVEFIQAATQLPDQVAWRAEHELTIEAAR
jgi:hypothetical protein